MDQQAILQVVPGLVGLVVIVAIVYRLYSTGVKRHQQKLEKLKQTGFSIDHLLESVVTVAFDDTARKIAFLHSKDKIKVYPYSDVLNMKWNYVNNISKNGHHTRKQNEIVFTLADPQNPLVKVFIPTERMAEHWAVKVQAIMH